MVWAVVQLRVAGFAEEVIMLLVVTLYVSFLFLDLALTRYIILRFGPQAVRPAFWIIYERGGFLGFYAFKQSAGVVYVLFLWLAFGPDVQTLMLIHSYYIAIQVLGEVALITVMSQESREKRRLRKRFQQLLEASSTPTSLLQ